MSIGGDAALEAALESLKIKNSEYLQNQTPQSTRGDAALEAALESLKIKNSEYMQNQTPQTASRLTRAMGRQANALANGQNTARQAIEMRKVKQDFERTTIPSKKFRIAHKLATTLVGMTARRLALWTIMGTTSAAGLTYALYDVNANGEVIGSADTSGDGLVDAVAVDTDGVAGADIMLQDTDANGLVDRMSNVDADGEIAGIVGEGGVFEALFEGVGTLFSFF